MKKSIILALIVLTQIVLSQSTDKEKALEFGKKAVKLVDSGKIDDGIILFKKAQDLDPENIIYPYEIAYAYYMQKKYQDAITLCEPLRSRSDVYDEVFRLIGNCYDLLGKQDKAMEEYDYGIEKFPKSGKLYHEKAICYLNMNNMEDAVKTFEKGVSVEPNYASNYYDLSKIYYNSEDEFWALIYAETFINLERSGKRTEEISKLLFDTYNKGIIVKEGKLGSVSFCRNPALNSKQLLLFETNFEMGLSLALVSTEYKSPSLASISKLRQSFLKLWYEKGFNEKYNCGLFEYVNSIYKNGYADAYDYYIMGFGDENSIIDWVQKNESAYNNFEKYYSANKLSLTENNSVYRGK